MQATEIFERNYDSNQKIVINTNHRFGGGRFDVNDFDGDGLSEVLFYATEAKFNMYNEEEEIEHMSYIIAPFYI